VRPLGATQEEPVDVRIVSATHKDLAADVQAGRFRQDLYYRLNVIEIIVPPLRERARTCRRCATAAGAHRADAGMPVPTLSARQVLAHRCRTRSRATCASWKTCCTAPWPWRRRCASRFRLR
jgi:two-component system response regulator PilR (NtrC family)